MTAGFLLVHAQAGAFTVWLQVGLPLANFGIGFLADRFGHCRGLEWGFISGSRLVYEFSAAEDRALYLGLANSIPGLLGSAPRWLSGRYTIPVSAILGHYGPNSPDEVKRAVSAWR